MKKVVKIIFSILSICIILLWVVIPCVKSIHKSINKSIVEKNEKYISTYKKYCEVLNITYEYDSDKEKITCVTEHPTDAIIMIYYYNDLNDENYTYGELLKEFFDFVVSKKNCETLDELYRFTLEARDIIPSKNNDDYTITLTIFFEMCHIYLGENYEDMSEDEVLKICDMVYSRRNEVYLYNIIYFMADYTDAIKFRKYIPLKYEYEEENINVLDEENAIIVNKEYTAYLKKGNWVWLGEGEKWIVTKVEIDRSNADNSEIIDYCVLERIGFKTIEKSKERYMLSKDEICFVTKEYENGECTKVSVEVDVDAIYGSGGRRTLNEYMRYTK